MSYKDTLNYRLDNIVNRAITNKIAPSISLFVGFDHKESSKDIIIHQGYTHKNPLIKTNEDTIYDLASLTKILSTTLAIAKAIIDTKIELKEKPFNSWPNISIEHILRHNSGLPAHIKFYDKQTPISKQALIAELFKIQPLNPPGLNHLYSDLGFIALGHLLEMRYQKPLKKIFDDAFMATNTGCSFASFSKEEEKSHYQVAPTGFCNFRKDYLRASVHDANCYTLGGLAGHAGLFGTLYNVIVLARFFLKCFKEPVSPLEHLLKFFMKNHLGFAKKERGGSVSALSAQSFGHFGFTGTSLFIDPQSTKQRGLIIALLTNRVHEGDDKNGIFWLRKTIHEMVIKF